jgi:hypothetical protein
MGIPKLFETTWHLKEGGLCYQAYFSEVLRYGASWTKVWKGEPV